MFIVDDDPYAEHDPFRFVIGGSGMTVQCWGCMTRVNSVGQATGDPVGTCWECHVFACLGHGERDRYSGKWLCFPSVATAAAASAGLPDLYSQTKFQNREDAIRRFPRIIEKSEGDFGIDDAKRRVTTAFESPTNTIDWDLLAVAIKISNYLLSEVREPGVERRKWVDEVLPQALIMLLVL